jgi:hypothetical protein
MVKGPSGASTPKNQVKTVGPLTPKNQVKRVGLLSPENQVKTVGLLAASEKMTRLIRRARAAGWQAEAARAESIA